ncbi:MAG: GtrA family protein [Myxococcus sp.]|nr:GtrA family protein [Myxococcus sp.]
MWKRLRDSWVVRGLGAGAATSLLDHAVGVTLALLGAPTRAAAMSGKVVGAVFSYFAHRRFTFRDHAQPLVASGARYLAFVILITLVHGQVVVWLRDGLGLPYVIAAVLADVTVVTPAWMLALRYVIFPAAPPRESGAKDGQAP